MKPTESITLTSLVDEIAYRLEAAILEGEFGPGTHLLQDELCARFGVSRTPVREALRKLQAQHLVVLVPNKGATVRFPSRSELSDVYVVGSSGGATPYRPPAPSDLCPSRGEAIALLTKVVEPEVIEVSSVAPMPSAATAAPPTAAVPHKEPEVEEDPVVQIEEQVPDAVAPRCSNRRKKVLGKH